MSENTEHKSRGKKEKNSPRMLEIANALGEFLTDGEILFVQKKNDDVLVSVPQPKKFKYSPVKFLYPELYGRLLSADKQLSDASGCFTICLIFLFAFAICLSLHLKILTGIFKQAAEFRNLWVYFFIMICCFWLALLISEYREKRAYRRVRQEVLAAICDSDIDYLFLLAQIEDDTHVEKVGSYIKRDSMAGVCFVSDY